jgi:hypothetical protein
MVGVTKYIGPFCLALTQLYPNQRPCQEFLNYFEEGKGGANSALPFFVSFKSKSILLLFTKII